jgi:Icc-related predicted phosphoesterase
MPDAPYWLAFGDIHDDLSRFYDIPELAGAGGVIITGDLTLRGGWKQAWRVLEPVAARVPLLLAQIGNMDREEVTGRLEEKGWNLHARAREIFPAVFALGVGCSPETPFDTPSEHPESRLAAWLEQALGEAGELSGKEVRKTGEKGEKAAERQGDLDLPPLVLVSHTPPHATACDRLRSGVPAGSTAVRGFIEKYQPELCLCGHIHEARATDAIGTTQIINPGPLSEGGYIILRLEGEGRAARLTGELKVLA